MGPSISCVEGPLPLSGPGYCLARVTSGGVSPRGPARGAASPTAAPCGPAHAYPADLLPDRGDPSGLADLLLDRPTALRPAGPVHAVRLISCLTGQPPCVQPGPCAPSG